MDVLRVKINGEWTDIPAIIGPDGTTFTPSVDSLGNLSWSNTDGKPNPPTVNIKGPQGQAGRDGAPGQTGAAGTTFIPYVASNGDISWSNDGGKPNPPTVNINGPQGPQGPEGPAGKDGAPGQDGAPGVGVPSGGTAGQILRKTSSTDYATEWADQNPVVSVSGSTPSITAMAGVRYVCGEVSTLAVTVPASGCVDIVFESGSTPAVLTVTSAKTGVSAIKWTSGWDETCEANTVYEINILDGEYGVVAAWT